ncbi:MAG TPA: response regulator [Puia sp.]|jgi:CheY-like chemotaxis protein|nr:response regulator [Puia sp.]
MQEIHILLVDDNEGDVLLTKEALAEAKIVNRISVAYDGVQALRFLKKEPPFMEQESPDLILLDINLPRMDGTEVLGIIKSDPELKRIPVIMLTTSSSEKDIFTSYDNYANCYITKPVDLERFMDVVRTIEDFWISIVKLPKSA